mgnify:CR=1 FL=1
MSTTTQFEAACPACNGEGLERGSYLDCQVCDGRGVLDLAYAVELNHDARRRSVRDAQIRTLSELGWQLWKFANPEKYAAWRATQVRS